MAGLARITTSKCRLPIRQPTTSEVIMTRHVVGSAVVAMVIGHACLLAAKYPNCHYDCTVTITDSGSGPGTPFKIDYQDPAGTYHKNIGWEIINQTNRVIAVEMRDLYVPGTTTCVGDVIIGDDLPNCVVRRDNIPPYDKKKPAIIAIHATYGEALDDIKYVIAVGDKGVTGAKMDHRDPELILDDSSSVPTADWQMKLLLAGLAIVGGVLGWVSRGFMKKG
jgi:hypothetical protein